MDERDSADRTATQASNGNPGNEIRATDVLPDVVRVLDEHRLDEIERLVGPLLRTEQQREEMLRVHVIRVESERQAHVLHRVLYLAA